MSFNSEDPSNSNPITRRRSLKTLANTLAIPAASMVVVGQVRAQAPAIVLGQTLALSGPIADLGKALSAGAKVYFDQLNARGGIKGRQVKLTTLDDGYDVQRSQDNIAQLLQERDTLGLFNVMGTPMIEAALPMLRSTGTLLFAPFSGALSAFPKDVRSVIPIRASYPDEVAQIVQHLTTIGLKKIALVTQANSFGDEVLASAIAALDKRSLKAVAQQKVKSDASDVAPAVAATISAAPNAVIVGLGGKAAVETIKALRAANKGVAVYALSVMGASGSLKALGDAGPGVTISQVVPMPTKDTVPVVREFRQAFAAAKTEIEPSHLALEGYINAKAFSLIAGRISGPLSGKAIVEATWSTKKLDLGGFEIGFTAPGSSASRFVELTMVTPKGFAR